MRARARVYCAVQYEVCTYVIWNIDFIERRRSSLLTVKFLRGDVAMLCAGFYNLHPALGKHMLPRARQKLIRGCSRSYNSIYGCKVSSNPEFRNAAFLDRYLIARYLKKILVIIATNMYVNERDYFARRENRLFSGDGRWSREGSWKVPERRDARVPLVKRNVIKHPQRPTAHQRTNRTSTLNYSLGASIRANNEITRAHACT